jgi:predicted regulator of Ras-like GTPase activity (Roadblock/LC7/MglB family)
VHDATEVELPLRVIAPLFLARQSAAAKAQPKQAIDETIPNLFFGFPKPEAGSAPTQAPQAPQATPLPKPSPVSSEGDLISVPHKPSDTNYYVWNETSDTTRGEEADTKKKPSAGTDFVARYATPNEIVSRAGALEGVAGALIALPDGLMVASRLSPEINGDTLAAFLPQIFAKVNQCTRELRMGELNNLNFTVGNIPWKIFRVNAIFFAAFGRVAEPLPTAALAALAAELDRKR